MSHIKALKSICYSTPHLLEFLILTVYRTLPTMVPLEDDIANFLAVAADADEGTAFMFLEVRHPTTFSRPYYRFTDMNPEECRYHR